MKKHKATILATKTHFEVLNRRIDRLQLFLSMGVGFSMLLCGTLFCIIAANLFPVPPNLTDRLLSPWFFLVCVGAFLGATGLAAIGASASILVLEAKK